FALDNSPFRSVSAPDDNRHRRQDFQPACPPANSCIRGGNFLCGRSCHASAGVDWARRLALVSGTASRFSRSPDLRVNRAIACLTSIVALHRGGACAFCGGACAFCSGAAAFVRASVSVVTRAVVAFNELPYCKTNRYSATSSNSSLRGGRQ